VSKPSILLVLVFLSFVAQTTYAQKVITTETGKKIIINADGTWADYTEPVKETPNKDDITVEAQIAFNGSEQDDYQLLKAEIVKRFEDVKSRQFKNKNNITVVKDEIKRAKKEKRDDLALKRLEERKLQYYLTEYDLEKEMDAMKVFKISVDRIDNQGFNSTLYQNLKQNFIAFAGNDYAQSKSNEEHPNTETNTTAEKASTVASQNQMLSEEELLANGISRELRYYSFETDDKDVLRNPPATKCKVKLKGIDKRTRKERTELEAGYLFGYTHPNIKSYFKENDFLTCYAKLSKVGGLYYLSLEVRIASIKANKTYGSLDKGSPIRIKLLDGETVNLYNLTAATGFIEPITGVTVYQANYPLEKGEYKQVSKTELDKIGLIWSTGYEEYEIFEVDFLMTQAECLKKA